ncbi:dihydrofolate reductase family protein [Rathayibacter oskolensis]|uniref:dihydrofolate reductase family protein n=1 Tax=Rathayibacter oskolensis TaxID=1891671 RepID=UPI00265DBB2A|nr:dihydrofolate reductase family protein [Rathayibacter oskolensis]WKK73267.1 dihydrofolate reductase family protein [Rathayibacter oskolensis]
MSAAIDLLHPSAGADLDDDELLALYSREAAERWLRVNFVSSIDGAVTHDGVSGDLGGEADLRVFDLLRRLADVVLVAAGTVRAEGYGPMVLGEEAATARAAAGLPRTRSSRSSPARSSSTRDRGSSPRRRCGRWW